MGACAGCCFKTAYTLYAYTCVGRCVHNKYIKHFKQQYGENAVHSKLTPFMFDELLIIPLPFLMNNYAYMVADVRENTFVLIDVGEASKMKDYPMAPSAILTTHKHWDHSAGNKEMRAAYPNLSVYGGAADHVPNSTHSVTDGQIVKFGRLEFTAIWTPGHTKGHTVWRLNGAKFGMMDSVFTGDCLMTAGCGAPFEGPVSTLISSLDKLGQLPADTLVWPGHEMAVDGLELAVYIEPTNMSAVLKLVWSIARRENMLCACPSTIQEELSYNPFMRTTNESFLRALGLMQYLEEHPGVVKDNKERSIMAFDWILQKSDDLRIMKRKTRKEVHLAKNKAENENKEEETIGSHFSESKDRNGSTEIDTVEDEMIQELTMAEELKMIRQKIMQAYPTLQEDQGASLSNQEKLNSSVLTIQKKKQS